MRQPLFRLMFMFVMVLVVLAPAGMHIPSAAAQSGVYPLPAPLYILTSDGMLLSIDPANGAQTEISNPNQPVADFAIAPSGDWIVFRTANEGMVIVRQVAGQSGYVLDFDTILPDSTAQTIAWSADAAAIAYLVANGVQIAYPGAGQYGEALIGLVQGNWSELYWAGPDTLIVSDSSGTATQISGSYEQWTLTPDAAVARPQPDFAATLSAEGVLLNGQPVPGTAGALAFDWGPTPPDAVSAYTLPANLYFIAPDANGTDQVWRLPQDNTPVQQLTTGSAVSGYGISPDGQRLTYVTNTALIVYSADGSSTHQLATLDIDLNINYQPVMPQWSPDSTRIAYHDQRGIWIVPADGSQAPRLVAPSVTYNDQAVPGSVRTYAHPQWNPDGTRLLITIGLWESIAPGVLDLNTATVTELFSVVSSSGTWTADGRVLAWSWYYGYADPGLFLLDPVQPDAEPVTLIAQQTVWDVIPGPAGGWYALVSTGAEMGPHLLTVWQAPGLDGIFAPVFSDTVGGFADDAQLATDGARFMIAGVQAQTEDQGVRNSGEIRLIDVSHNTTLRLAEPAPAHSLQWGP